jgi:hypothetical protein
LRAMGGVLYEKRGKTACITLNRATRIIAEHGCA